MISITSNYKRVYKQHRISFARPHDTTPDDGLELYDLAHYERLGRAGEVIGAVIGQIISLDWCSALILDPVTNKEVKCPRNRVTSLAE